MDDLMDRVLEEAVQLVEPTPEESRHVERVAEEVLARVKAEVEGLDLRVGVVLGGSYAKGTWLKGEADIDIFMKFPPQLSRPRLEELSVSLGRDALKDSHPVLRYSEHPYVEAVVEGVRVNVVGCYDVRRGEWRSAADRSPYHTEFMKGRLDEWLRRQARLLKKFMKGAGLYGAEIAVEGFSGYVCEVLILNFHSLLSTLRAAADFKEGEVITLDQRRLEGGRFQGPLTIIDPIDPARNLGAAISPRNVARFILASRSFLQKPDLKYFTGGVETEPSARLRTSPLLEHLVAVTFTHQPRSVDILWGQLKRTLRHLVKGLKLKGFGVMRAECATDEEGRSALLFLLEDVRLPPITTRVGPKVSMRGYCEKFLQKHVNSAQLLWVGEDERIHLAARRDHPTVEGLLEEMLKKGVALGIAPGLSEDISRSFEIYVGRGILAPASRMRWLAEAGFRLVSRDEFTFNTG